MADAGILGVDDRVELIEGEVVEMNPIGSHHASSVDRLNRSFSKQTADRAIIRVQNPVRLSDLSEPQPDLALLKPRDDFYASSHPTAADVLLLVEVADSSLAFDSGVKLALYAAAGIPEVWIINLSAALVESHRSPQSGRFSEHDSHVKGDQISPAALPDLSLDVAEIF